MAPAYKSQSALVKSFQPGDRALAMACRTTVPGLEKRKENRWSRLRKKPALISKFMAPPQYDLASLLNDRVTDSVIRPALEERLVRYYIERRGELEKRKISADEFWEIYRLSAIQRDLKVVGRFYYLDLVKGKPGYMKFVPPTARRLERNLANVAQTQPVLELLREHFEAMR